MRLTQSMSKRWQARLQYEQSYNIPFQDLYPLALADKIQDQYKNVKSRPCIPQLTVLLQCFKETDFNQKRCAESIKAYTTCVEETLAQQGTAIKNRKLTEVKRVKDLTQAETTQLLKRKPIN